MGTDEHGLKHSAVTSQVIRAFFQVYNELGAGFLESVYVEALDLALSEAGLSTQREVPLAVTFRGHVVGRFRADLVVERNVLVEAKACPRLHPSHEAQVLNYLRATVLEGWPGSELWAAASVQTPSIRQRIKKTPSKAFALDVLGGLALD